MKPKEAIMIEGKKGDFYFVRKQNGVSGYIKKEYVQNGTMVKIKIDRQSKNFQMPKLNGPIQLTWEAVYTKNPNPSPNSRYARSKCHFSYMVFSSRNGWHGKKSSIT